VLLANLLLKLGDFAAPEIVDFVFAKIVIQWRKDF
jgi:hypothetical protein